MCLALWDPMDCPWNSPGQNTGVGSLSLLQRIFPTQGSNPGLLHCRQILYQLNHKRSPRILELVAYTFSSRSSRPRNQTGVSCTAGRFFTNWAMREALKAGYESIKGSPSHLYQMLITRDNSRPLAAQRRPQWAPHYKLYSYLLLVPYVFTFPQFAALETNISFSLSCPISKNHCSFIKNAT